MIDLNDYDLIIVNSSAGKDSLASLWEICRLADLQKFPKKNVVVSHQDLGDIEWPGTKELVKTQSEHFGVSIYYSKRRKHASLGGQEENLLEYAERRGKWPSSKQRWCTSDFKRGPGARVVTMLTKQTGQCKVLYVFGFRKEESPSRSNKKEFAVNLMLTTKKRQVFDYLPIHNWSTKKVWDTIRKNNLPYHPAYDLGMPRLSCCFCIFSPFDALVVAGKANPELLKRYIEVEKKINHTFKSGFAIKEVQDAIDKGYKPKSVANWVM